MQSSTRLSKFVIRFMLDSDNPAKPMLGSEHQRAIAGPFQMVHHGQTYHVYFGLNVENSYLFLFIQILDHPIQILGIAMLVSTPLCLLLAWRLTRPYCSCSSRSPNSPRATWKYRSPTWVGATR